MTVKECASLQPLRDGVCDRVPRSIGGAEGRQRTAKSRSTRVVVGTKVRAFLQSRRV